MKKNRCITNQSFPRRMFNSGGRKSDDSVFTAAGEKAGLLPRASLERDACNVSTDAKPRLG